MYVKDFLNAWAINEHCRKMSLDNDCLRAEYDKRWLMEKMSSADSELRNLSGYELASMIESLDSKVVWYLTGLEKDKEKLRDLIMLDPNIDPNVKMMIFYRDQNKSSDRIRKHENSDQEMVSSDAIKKTLHQSIEKTITNTLKDSIIDDEKIQSILSNFHIQQAIKTLCEQVDHCK